jgi:hypothetical protein
VRDPAPLRHTWASAFSTQALADLETRDLLAETNAEPFARLHFLQMAAEKLCKAYLLDENGFDDLSYSHCIVQKQLPRVIEHVLQRTTDWSAGRRRAYLRELKPLIREMELLSPACDEKAARPDNCEYPWLDAPEPSVYPPNIVLQA